jgi:autotransporter translocation and assembly factor TamB
VDGRIDCSMTGDGLLHFAADGLGLGRGTMTWQGPLTVGSWEPAWSVTATDADIHEVAQLVNSWTGSTVFPDWVSGIGNLQVTLSGPWNQLVIGARIDAQPLRLDRVELDRLVSEGTIRGDVLTLGPTRFSVAEGSGEVEGSVAWASGTGDEQLKLAIRANRLPLARAAAWFGAAGSTTGVLSFTGRLRGPLASPRGSWAVGIDDAVLLGQELGDGSATVDLADGRFDGRAISFDHGLTGGVFWDLIRSEVGGGLEWAAMPMTVLPEPLATLAGGQGDVRLDFVLPRDGFPTGRVEAVCPGARAVAEAGRDEVVISASAADSITASATLARLPNGGLRGPGEIRLDSAQNLVSRLVADSTLPLAGSGRAEVTLDWQPESWPRLAGELVDLDLELDQRPIRLIDPARFELSDRGFHTTGLHVGVRQDRLFVRCAIDADGELTGNVSGTMDALLLRFLLPDWEPAGRVTGVVELLGSIDRPLFEGIAEVGQGSFRLPGTRTILSGIDGTVLLSADHASLEGMGFRFMQGMGRCSGRITLRDGTFNLGLDGSVTGLRYEMLPGLVAVLSGSWRLAGPVDRLDLGGDVTVDRATLRRKDDIPTLLIDWFGETAPETPTAGALRLNLHVEADQTIDVRNPFVRLVGSASLDISGTSDEPGIVGKVEFEEGGEVMVQTLRYELERGALTFSDPTRTDPFIELQANTWVQNYQITVRIAGTPDRLTTSVNSNPPLTEEEILSLMAVGYRRQNIGGGAMGVSVASTMLTREITAALDRRARLLLPVDQVRVDPFAETASGNPTARLSMVKQLSPTWTLILQSNLSAQREEVVVSRWFIAPGVFVEASRDLDGSYGFDIKLRRPY